MDTRRNSEHLRYSMATPTSTQTAIRFAYDYQTNKRLNNSAGKESWVTKTIDLDNSRSRRRTL